MCRCLVKFILFAINLIFVIIGILVVAGGAILISQLKSVTELTEKLQINLDFIPYSIITLGVIVFLISFFGCCGTITETKCLLITYSVCMALLAAAKIVLAILVFVRLNDFTNTVETAINDMFISDDPYQNATFHILESQFKCCGTTGPDAYVNDYNLTSPTCCALDGNTTSPIGNLPIGNLPIGNLPIDNLPIANRTKKNIQRENAPIDLGNLPADKRDVDLGNLDLAGIDLGNIDLESLGNLTCKREDAFETGCTKLIGGAINEIGKSIGIGMIVVIGFEVLVLFFSIYLIKTMRPKHPKYIEQPRYYY